MLRRRIRFHVISGAVPAKVSLVLTSMALNGGLLYIDGHWDWRRVQRWPHSITDDDLKAVIGANLTATARVSPSLNPHVHCHDAMAPFSVTGERMNVAGSWFSGLSMRCTSTPPCLLARQKKASSSAAHRRRWHMIHCNKPPVTCALAVVDEGECSVASLVRVSLLPEDVCWVSGGVLRLVASACCSSTGNASASMEELSLCSVAAALSQN